MNLETRQRFLFLFYLYCISNIFPFNYMLKNINANFMIMFYKNLLINITNKIHKFYEIIFIPNSSYTYL